MIKVSIHYPNKPGRRFDVDYYLERHMPLALNRLGTGVKGVSVEVGIGGGAPDQPPPFVASCHYRCESVEAFLAAFLPHAAELQGDIANYTDVEPLIQFSEIRLSQ